MRGGEVGVIRTVIWVDIPKCYSLNREAMGSEPFIRI